MPRLRFDARYRHGLPPQESWPQLRPLLFGRQEASRRTAALGVAFVGLGVADSSFLVNLANHSYSSNIVLAVVWGSSFGILVGAAVTRPRAMIGPHAEPHNSRLMLASTAVALALLVLHPGGTIGWFVVIPAVVTLVCAGGRLVLALRESEGAAEALRLSLTDELTGLPNRRALLSATERRLASPGGRGCTIAQGRAGRVGSKRAAGLPMYGW